MQGAKIIRTSNWDAMTQFYRDSLGMRERDHESKDSLHEFADFGTEVHLERVSAASEHELCGSLELYSSDPERFATFFPTSADYSRSGDMLEAR
jgi:catechol 2,3-dioxygenase-like lactoylglutathione lyase family enzyme